MKKIVLWICVTLFAADLHSQIVIEISSLKELKRLVPEFLYDNEGYPVDYGFDTYDILTNTRYKNLKTPFSYQYALLEIYIGMIHSYTHLIIKDNHSIYLINMRNPRDSIVATISLLPNINHCFFNKCIEEIKNLHRKNWNKNHSEEQYYIDENDRFQQIDYDPNKW